MKTQPVVSGKLLNKIIKFSILVYVHIIFIMFILVFISLFIRGK